MREREGHGMRTFASFSVSSLATASIPDMSIDFNTNLQTPEVVKKEKAVLNIPSTPASQSFPFSLPPCLPPCLPLPGPPVAIQLLLRRKLMRGLPLHLHSPHAHAGGPSNALLCAVSSLLHDKKSLAERSRPKECHFLIDRHLPSSGIALPCQPPWDRLRQPDDPRRPSIPSLLPFFSVP